MTKKRTYRSLLVFSLSISVWFLGCDRITRDSAKDAIAKSSKFNEPPSIYVKIGTMGQGCVPSATDAAQALLSALGYLTVTSSGKASRNASLTEKGIGFLRDHKESPYAAERKGGCDTQQVTFPVAEREMERVTGIVENETTARVEFLWHWRLNEIGEAIADRSGRTLTPKQWSELDSYWTYRAETCQKDPVCLQYTPAVAPFKTNGLADLPHQASVIFTKYDDGWRLE